jgi:hypothetical protein
MNIVNKVMNQQITKYLLMVDTCPAHTKVENLSEVRVKFLPPNATPVLQPLDQAL